MRTCLLLMASLAGTALIDAGTSPARAAPVMAPGATSAAVHGPGLTRVGYDDWDDDDYDDDDYYVARSYPPPYVYAPPPAVVGAPPFVYGWPPPPPRPASCGQYRYWNGEFCADARFRPPYIGPRW